jgi:hypothetical protein
MKIAIRNAHSNARCRRRKRIPQALQRASIPVNTSHPSQMRRLQSVQRPVAILSECALQGSPPRYMRLVAAEAVPSAVPGSVFSQV